MEHRATILTDETVPAMAIVVAGPVAGNDVSWEQEHERTCRLLAWKDILEDGRKR